MFRSISLIFLLLPCASALRAQAAGDAPASMPEVRVSADSAAFGGYEIFDQASVTRGNLALREVPQTVEVIDMEGSAIYGHGSLTDVLDGLGGVVAERNSYPGGRDTVRLRGFATYNTDIYVDGVRGNGVARYSTANVERVEVLKGPASVLYGRSNGGGIVNVVSKVAHFAPRQSLGAGYGAWAERHASVDINRVVNDHWAFRLTGQMQRAHSFRKRIDSKGEMLSPSVAYKNGGLRWTGQLTYDHLWGLPDRGITLRHHEFSGLSPRVSIVRPEDDSRDLLKVARSDLHYDLNPDWQLRLQTTWQRMHYGWHHHFMGAFVGNTNYLLRQSYYAEHAASKQMAHALTLTGTWRSGFIRHQLTTALDYSTSRQDAFGGSIPAQDAARLNPPIDLRDPATWVAAPGVRENYTISYDDALQIDNLAWLVQDVMEFAPRWKLMLGGRIEQHKVSGTKKRESGQPRFDFKDRYFSPNLGLVWDANSAHTAYVGYSKSFSPPGGKGGRSINLAEQYQHSPEHSRQYEAGLKSDWLGGALATQLALYELTRYNIPYRPDADAQPEVWAMSGAERARGIEFSAAGKMARHWQLRTSLGFMNAKVQKDASNPAREGLHLSGTSNAQGSVFVRYAPSRAFFAESGVRWTSLRYRPNTGPRNDFTIDSLPGYARVDAALGFAGEHWRATLALSNVLDKAYWGSILMPGEPRALRVRLHYEF